MQIDKKWQMDKINADWGFAETLLMPVLQRVAFQLDSLDKTAEGELFFIGMQSFITSSQMKITPRFRHISEKQGRVQIFDSILSEEAALGFEYGYATANPESLVIWEAQFGDFVNGAQAIIDQFISSGEAKWGRLSNLVMLLPHGLEGQGPEHSSGRLERFLQLCASHNMQVCVPSTAAQIFHLLRRQSLEKVTERLSLLCLLKACLEIHCASPLFSLLMKNLRLYEERYDNIKPKKVDRVVLCSGKVFYELLTASSR